MVASYAVFSNVTLQRMAEDRCDGTNGKVNAMPNLTYVATWA